MSPQLQKMEEFLKFKNSEQGRALVTWARDQYDRMKSVRLQQTQQWYIYLSMYGGQQYNEWLTNRDGTFGRLGVPKAPTHRTRAVVNKLRPIIRTEMARLTSQKPTVSVVPATTEDNDMMAASAAEALWESMYETKKLQEKLVQNSFWSSVLGNGFMKVYWDNNKIDKGSIDPNTGKAPVGDVEFGVVTPFNIFVPDLLEVDIEDQPYIMQAYTKTVSWVKQFWGPFLNNAEPTVVSQTELIDQSYFGLPRIAGNEAKPDSCLVIEMYIKPGGHKLAPNGCMLTIVNKELVLFTDGMPYSHDEYPFAHNIIIPTGKFYGESVLSDLIPLQKEYNRTRSQIIESKNRTARPQLLAPRGSIQTQKVTSEPGLIIEYLPGFAPPQPLPMQSLPAYVMQEQDRINQDMEDISGQHQVSRGQAPGGGVEAATAISFLQEKDDSLLSTAYSSYESMLQKLGRQALTLTADYVDLPRIIRIVGSDGSFDSLEFKGSTLATAQDLRIEAGSSLPTSKPARQALLMDLVKMGALAPDKMLQMLEIGGFNKLVEQLRIDQKEAQRENLRMKKLTPQNIQEHTESWQMQLMQDPSIGQDENTGLYTMNAQNPETFPPVIEVHDWQNHAVHIQVHNDYRKSQDFELLPDPIKEQFQKHVALHMVQVQNLQMQQQQMGMPPGPQGGPADVNSGAGGMPPGMPGGQPGGF